MLTTMRLSRKSLLLRMPGGIVIGRVCWLVRYARTDFSKSNSPVFMKFGTDVQRLRQM